MPRTTCYRFRYVSMDMSKKKIHLWKLLKDRGLFPDRKTATGWIMSGKVLVDDHPVTKAGHSVAVDARIRIRDYDRKYVGKGGLKLEGALEDFGIDVSGKVAIDAGASIGGFTDCLLQNGASKVYAVDAGLGQLAGKLRINERVVNMERTNISDINPEELDPKPDFATVDLSYLSLTKGIPIVSRLLNPKGEMLCLVKPLFEVSDSVARRTGKIETPEVYGELLRRLIDMVEKTGIFPVGVSHSHVTGNKGTREFFLYISLDAERSDGDIHFDIDHIVAEAMKVPIFQRNN